MGAALSSVAVAVLSSVLVASSVAVAEALLSVTPVKMVSVVLRVTPVRMPVPVGKVPVPVIVPVAKPVLVESPVGKGATVLEQSLSSGRPGL